MTKNGTEDGNSPEYVRMQADFLSALGTTTDFLREAGVPGGDMMVISGGATFLYELDQTGASDRGPTDLDVIFRPTLEAPERFYGLFAELEENDRFVNSYLHTKPRTHQ